MKNVTGPGAAPRNSETAIVDKDGDRRGPLPAIAALLLLSITLFVLLMPSSSPSVDVASVELPELFDAPPPCTGGDPAFRAEHLRDAAFAMAERRFFAPQDGIRAVSFYAEAARCFRDISADDRADRASAAAARLRQDIRDEVAQRRLRLDRALEAGDAVVVLQQASALRAVFAHRPESPFVQVLRRIEARASREVLP